MAVDRSVGGLTDPPAGRQRFGVGIQPPATSAAHFSVRKRSRPGSFAAWVRMLLSEAFICWLISASPGPARMRVSPLSRYNMVVHLTTPPGLDRQYGTAIAPSGEEAFLAFKLE